MCAVGERTMSEHYLVTAIAKSICLAGPDGAGKSTQAERLVRRLVEKGHAVRVATIWDLFDQRKGLGLQFESKLAIDRFLGAVHPDGRAMFLHSAMREALDRALENRGDAVLVVVGYWPKYNATERVYGASGPLLDALAASFPALGLPLYLEVPPEVALGRKTALSAYESRQAGRDGFLPFQREVQAALADLRHRFGPWQLIDGTADADAVESAIAEAVDAYLAGTPA